MKAYRAPERGRWFTPGARVRRRKGTSGGSNERVPLAASVLAGVREVSIVASLLAALVMPSAATGAGAATPDRAPAGGVSSSSPSPDPSPGATVNASPSTAASTPSSSVSVSHQSSVVTAPLATTRFGRAAASPARAIVASQSSLAVTSSGAPQSSRRPARTAARMRHRTAAGAPVRGLPPRALLLAPRHDFAPPAGRPTPASAVVRHDRVWLLLSAMALAVLVIASLALLRAVRLNQAWWEGRTQ